MSRHDEPKLRLVHGGASFPAATYTASGCPAGSPLVDGGPVNGGLVNRGVANGVLADERFARRIGWQVVDEPALSDDYEDRLAARIFGGGDLDTIPEVISRDVILRDVIALDVIALDGRVPRAATDAPVESAPEIRGWLLLTAAAVALLLIGGAAVVTPAGEATLTAPAPRLAPIEWPERTPEVDAIHAHEVLDELPPEEPLLDEPLLDEPSMVDLTAQPAPGPSPRAPDPGASSGPVRLAVHSSERRLEEVSPAAVEAAFPGEPEGAGRDPELDVVEVDISPDGEPPRLAAIVSRSAGLAPIALPGPAVGIALADPAGTAEPPTLRDHLSAAGHGDGTMAVLDIIGAGRQVPGRL